MKRDLQVHGNAMQHSPLSRSEALANYPRYLSLKPLAQYTGPDKSQAATWSEGRGRRNRATIPLRLILPDSFPPVARRATRPCGTFGRGLGCPASYGGSSQHAPAAPSSTAMRDAQSMSRNLLPAGRLKEPAAMPVTPVTRRLTPATSSIG